MHSSSLQHSKTWDGVCNQPKPRKPSNVTSFRMTWFVSGLGDSYDVQTAEDVHIAALQVVPLWLLVLGSLNRMMSPNEEWCLVRLQKHLGGIAFLEMLEVNISWQCRLNFGLYMNFLALIHFFPRTSISDHHWLKKKVSIPWKPWHPSVAVFFGPGPSSKAHLAGSVGGLCEQFVLGLLRILPPSTVMHTKNSRNQCLGFGCGEENSKMWFGWKVKYRWIQMENDGYHINIYKYT